MVKQMTRIIALLAVLALPAQAQEPDLTAPTITTFFLAAGMRPFQAEAFTRHAWLESRYERCVVGRSGSYLFQWTGIRLRRLAHYARMSGCPPLRTQLSFALHEIKTERLYACFWRQRAYRSALAALRRGFGRGHC